MVALRSTPQPTSIRELRDRLSLSRERLARLLDVSAKTVERWELQGTSANRATQARLAQIEAIADLGRVVFTAEGLVYFLTTPMPVFDGHTALQLIEIGQGERVLGELAADYEGLGY